MYTWDNVFKNGPSKIFLKAVFHSFYLIHSPTLVTLFCNAVHYLQNCFNWIWEYPNIIDLTEKNYLQQWNAIGEQNLMKFHPKIVQHWLILQE